jgi:hypothetical protein
MTYPHQAPAGNPVDNRPHRSNSTTEEEFEHRLQLTMRLFAKISRGDFTNVEAFVRTNPSILRADPQLLLNEAARAQAHDLRDFRDSCVQQAVILEALQRKDSNGRRRDPDAFFRSLKSPESQTLRNHYINFDNAMDDTKKKAQRVSLDAPLRYYVPGDRKPDVYESDTEPGPRNPTINPPRSGPRAPMPFYDDFASAPPWDTTADSGSSVPPPPKRRIINETRDEYQRSVKTLDPRYKIHLSDFYRCGRVFALLWTEPYGETAKRPPNSRESYTSDPVSIVRYRERVYSTIRRMVVVREGRGYSVCIQINTYSGKGLEKFHRLEDINAHSIIYKTGTEANWLPGEPRSNKVPIMVSDVAEEHRLDPASRLCYSKPHTVEHNVRTMDIGVIRGSSWERVLEYYRLAQI